MPAAYGLFAAAGCIVGVLWLHAHRRRLGVGEGEFWAAMWVLLAGGVVGAKLFFLWLGWEHYARGELRFWADFRVGFVFFGGLLGAASAGGLFAWWRGLSFRRGADYFAVALPLGHAVGRLGCWVAGCCHGRDGHPVQLYESAGLGLIAWICARVVARVESGAAAPGSAFRLYLGLYGALRLLLDPLRGDGRPERFLGLSHQQGIALLLIAAALAWTIAAGRRRTSSSAKAPARRGASVS